jgi:hypothetical protein
VKYPSLANQKPRMKYYPWIYPWIHILVTTLLSGRTLAKQPTTYEFDDLRGTGV